MAALIFREDAQVAKNSIGNSQHESGAADQKN
jgi:hypothetical protein